MNIELPSEIRSPFTGGPVKEVFRLEEREFRREKYLVHARFFRCEDTGGLFTTTGQDALLFDDLYSQYRNAHGIPFPDELRALREGYGLSCAQISRLTGFGINQWGQYEEGTMPSESNARTVSLMASPEGMKALLEAAGGAFREDERRKILARVEASSPDDGDRFRRRLLYGGTRRGVMNGFAPLSPERLEEMTGRICGPADACGRLSPTRLSLLLFMCDFRHFRKTGRAISGLRYTAGTNGPMPEHRETVFDNIGCLAVTSRTEGDIECVSLTYSGPGEMKSALDSSEIATIEEVLSETSELTAEELVRMGREEPGWAENAGSCGQISFAWAVVPRKQSDKNR
jgi:hypothetical protein